MRTLDLSSQLRRTRLDIGMPDALVLDVPVELGQGPACCSASCAPCAHVRPSVAGSSHCDTGYDKPRHPRCRSRDSAPATRRYAGPQGGACGGSPVDCLSSNTLSLSKTKIVKDGPLNRIALHLEQISRNLRSVGYGRSPQHIKLNYLF